LAAVVVYYSWPANFGGILAFWSIQTGQKPSKNQNIWSTLSSRKSTFRSKSEKCRDLTLDGNSSLPQRSQRHCRRQRCIDGK